MTIRGRVLWRGRWLWGWVWGLVCFGLALGQGAELVLLTEANWAAYAPTGDAATAVLGDYVLQNDRLRVVVANPEYISGRSGSRNALRDRAAIIDLEALGPEGTVAVADRLAIYQLGPPQGNTRSDFENGTARYRPDYAEGAGFREQSGAEVTLTLRPRPHYSETCPVAIRYTLRDGEPYVHVRVTFLNSGKAPVKTDPYWVARDKREAEAAIRAAEKAEAGDAADPLAALLAPADDNGPLPDADLKRGETGPPPAPVVCKCPQPERLEAHGDGALTGRALDGSLQWVCLPGGGGWAGAAYGAWSPPGQALLAKRTQIAAGETLVLERVVMAAPDLAGLLALATPLADAAAREAGETPAARRVLRVAVTDNAGAVAGAWVTLARGARVLSAGRTDAAGLLTTALAADRYTLRAEAPGRAAVTTELQVVAGEATAPQEATLRLADAGDVTLQVRRGRPGEDPATVGPPMPARIVVIGAPDSATPTPILGPADGVSHVDNVVYTLGHPETLRLQVGRYLAIVTRGPAYTGAVLELDVTADAPLSRTATLHLIAMPGRGVAADFHGHTVWSGWSPHARSSASPAGRVRRLLAEGIDFAPAVEHDRVTDYGPLLAALGMSGELVTCPGIGYTDSGKYAFNQQLAFPIHHEPRWLDGGAPQRPQHCTQIAWLRSFGAPIAIDEPWLTAQTPELGYEKLIIVQQSQNRLATDHKRDYALRSALFRGADVRTVWNDDSALTKPFLRDSDGDGRADRITWSFERECDAWEVGDLQALLDPAAHGPNDILDWLETQRHHHRLPAVAAARRDSNLPGPNHLRNYVWIGERGDAGPHAFAPLDIVEAVRRGRVVLSTGPSVELRLAGAAPGAGVLGETIRDPRLVIDVSAAPWIRIEQVQLLIDGQADAARTYTRETHAALFRDADAEGRQFHLELELDLAADARISVIARGSTERLYRYPVPPPDAALAMDQVAITNPVYIDVDGDGRITPQSPVDDLVSSRLHLARGLRSGPDAAPAELVVSLQNHGDQPARDRLAFTFAPAGLVTLVGDPALTYDLAPGARATVRVPIALTAAARLDAQMAEPGARPTLTVWLQRRGTPPGLAPSRLVITVDADPVAQSLIEDDAAIERDWSPQD